MFGCLAVYVGGKIVFSLQESASGTPTTTTREHHESLRREFPSMRSIQAPGKDATGWQVLPADASDFEEAAPFRHLETPAGYI